MSHPFQSGFENLLFNIYTNYRILPYTLQGSLRGEAPHKLQAVGVKVRGETLHPRKFRVGWEGARPLILSYIILSHLILSNISLYNHILSYILLYDLTLCYIILHRLILSYGILWNPMFLDQGGGVCSQNLKQKPPAFDRYTITRRPFHHTAAQEFGPASGSSHGAHGRKRRTSVT